MTALLRLRRGSHPVQRFVSPPPRVSEACTGIPALLAFRIAPLASREELDAARLELPRGSAELRVLEVSEVGPDWEVVVEVL